MRAPLVLGSILLLASIPTTSATFDTSEAGRIQAHIARAEGFAARRDVSHLTRAQRAARARELGRLEAYRLRGIFPENHVRPGRTPVFVDGRGVHCAVGQLLALDGETALVARIAATRNCARVRELADEPELVAWLDRNGLTLEEAARIQPTYDGSGNPGGGGVKEKSDQGYEDAAITSALLSATAILADLDRGKTPESRRARVLYGSVVGTIGLGIGVAGFAREGESDFGAMSAVAGALAVVSTLHNHERRSTESRPLVTWTPRWAGGSRLAFVSAAF